MLIFDASTLILIAKIELLDLFLAGTPLQAAVPAAVERECCGKKNSLDALRIRKALEESRIKLIAVENVKLVSKLAAEFSLGKGEAQAITLGLSQSGSLVAVDDKNAINACKLLGIAFTTAIGILVRSREKDLLTRTEALASLASLARFGRYSEIILDDARLRLEEDK
jgi:predicted nucleic acid-binding protein